MKCQTKKSEIMKSIMKSNLFTTAVFMLFIFSIIGFWGCEKENLFESQYVKHLDVETYDMSKMSANEVETVGKALQRLNISKKNGLYQIKQTSGAQVNISEDLFEYIKKGFEYTNKIICPKSFDNQIPRLKSGSQEGDEDPLPENNPNDCVAHGLANMGNVSYDSAYAYIDSSYNGDGVPGSAMDSVVKNFYPNSTENYLPPTGGSMDNAMLIFRDVNGEGHAVNAEEYFPATNLIRFHDYSSGGQAWIYLEEVIKIYNP